jgi:hypothetical protein
VISRDREQGAPEASKETGCSVVLTGSAAVSEVTARDDQLGIDAADQRLESGRETGVLVAAGVQVGEVKNPCWRPGHSRSRLYTEIVVDEPTEIFDDLYLGLRAGGALRKKRRGEPLTTDEEEALGRWQRLSKVRKAVTLGAFSLGTFGLGFTIGGLIFGKWRRA